MSLLQGSETGIPYSDVKGLDGRLGFVSSRKVLLVGDSYVGKTTLIQSYLDWIIDDSYSIPSCQPKFNFDEYYTEFLYWDQIKSIIFYDIQGGEESVICDSVMYLELNLVVLCFSIDDPDSLESVEEIWCPKIDILLPYVPKILVGLKSDVRMQEDTSPETMDIDMGLASDLEALDIRERRGICHYLECSALTRVAFGVILEGMLHILMVNMFALDVTRRGQKVSCFLPRLKTDQMTVSKNVAAFGYPIT
ncbi:rho-related GTP-binding protein RhoA-A [Trichonephila clavata]|uniref:Rho-related GTP-binding protein RhoA-A n=1 Tax=Trichonephila clavata TaxID=2740835 RepID=A0A8X6GZ40_TRICU|nr:rho-related GTP-binding protein RhoA-A [Trichonephila clavata]